MNDRTDGMLMDYFVIVQHKDFAERDYPGRYYDEFPPEETIAEAGKNCDYVTIERRYETLPFA